MPAPAAEAGARLAGGGAGCTRLLVLLFRIEKFLHFLELSGNLPQPAQRLFFLKELFCHLSL